MAERLGGLPLAAEQAAAFLSLRTGISFDDYAADIARLIKLPKPEGTKGEYPETVYAAFVKSLEALIDAEDGAVALDILRLCAFLSPDGVDLVLLTSPTWIGEILPNPLATAIANVFVRENGLAALGSFSLLRQEIGPAGTVLIVHRLLQEVMRDWMGTADRDLWGSAAVRLVSGYFPGNAHSNPSIWPLCARLIHHVAPLEAHASTLGQAGRALVRLLNEAAIYLRTRGNFGGAFSYSERSVALS